MSIQLGRTRTSCSAKECEDRGLIATADSADLKLRSSALLIETCLEVPAIESKSVWYNFLPVAVIFGRRIS